MASPLADDAPAASSDEAAARSFSESAAAADLASLAIRAALDRLSGALARAVSAFVSVRAWTVFGFARLDDHARERCGRSGRWFRDLAALGQGIAATPRLADALTGADGGRPLGRVAATLVARADARGEAANDWIAAARCLSVRDLRAAIRLARAQAATRGDAAAAATDSPAGVDPAADPADADSAAGVPATGVPPADLDSADDPDADRVLLRLPVPSPLLPAFDEALDLHRALEGYASPVTAFVESLVGEAQSGGVAPAAGFVRPLEHGTPEERLEALLRRASAAWSALPEPLPAPAALVTSAEPLPAAGERCPADDVAASRGGGTSLDFVARFGAVEAVAGAGDAVELDRQIRALIDIENELEAELGRLLNFMTERGDWSRLQFAGVGHYAEERLGMSRSRAGERARLARALRSLPDVAAACASGRISMEAAALIHRILSDAADLPDADAVVGAPAPGVAAACGTSAPVPWTLSDLEAAWVEHAATVTVKRMRDEARALGRYRARSYASNALPATLATSPRPLPDSKWCASLRREAGTATRRIFAFGLRAAGLNPGPAASFDCGHDQSGPDPGAEAAEPDVFQEEAPAPSEPDVFHLPRSTPPEPDVFHSLMPEPDATLRMRLPADLAADLLAAIEAARGAVEARVALVPWDAPWPGGADGSAATADGAGASPEDVGASERGAASAAEWAARIAFIRGRRVPMWVGLLALLEDFAATWDTDAAAPERRDDRVFVRDGWRCMAPGCSSRRNLENHHIVYRSHGGDDRSANRVSLCCFHHQRGEHGGLMSVRGEAPLGLVWRLGRTDVAVTFRNERRDG